MPSGTNVPGDTPNFLGSGDGAYLKLFPPALPPGASGTVPPGAVPSSLGLPALSLPGNVIGLGINGVVMVWAWRRGGWWKVLSVVAAVNSLYFVGKIQSQV